MFIKTKDIINMPIEKIQSMFNKFSSYTNSKTLSKQEEQEFSEQALSFMNAMKKCGDGHLISPEMKPIVVILHLGKIKNKASKVIANKDVLFLVYVNIY